MKPHPFLPNSIWTTPKLNRDHAWKRRAFRQRQAEVQSRVADMQKIANLMASAFSSEEKAESKPVFVN